HRRQPRRDRPALPALPCLGVPGPPGARHHRAAATAVRRRAAALAVRHRPPGRHPVSAAGAPARHRSEGNAMTAHVDQTTGWDPPPPAPAVPPAGSASRPGGRRRLWRGRPEDPRWARPALLALLLVTGLLYLYDLDASGYANSFYSAAVQAGSQSW